MSNSLLRMPCASCEKKLETDRRHIARQIDEIRREIENVKATRQVQRSRRSKS